jgi:DNA polymerase
LDKKAEELLNDLKNRIDYFDLIGAGSILCAEENVQVQRTSTAAERSSAESLINKRILSCQRCDLFKTRTHAVPGEGNFNADLMFVGEGPGHDEDIKGKPFIGRAGQLLTKIIAAMGFDRKDVYITNVVKCRPPNNRNPQLEEMEACKEYLFEQIECIQPKVIVTLGKVATDFFIPGSVSIGAMRGKFHLFRDIPLMPTFHPSYLIRQQSNKELRRKVWNDMQKVMARLSK